MAILIDIKKKTNNVVYIEDYLKKKSKPEIFFSDELADLNRQIATHKREITDIIEKEIEEYEVEAEEASKKPKARLFAATVEKSNGDFNGKT